MTEQLPSIHKSHAVDKSVTRSGSLLGRGLAAIQNKKMDVAVSDLDARYRQVRDFYNRIIDQYNWGRSYIFAQADLFEADLLEKLEQVFTVFQQLANQGYGKAYFPLARMYEGEQGITQNIEKTFYYSQLAFSWCSINQGLDDSEIWRDLGWMYYNGFGIEEDNDEAVFWYCKAAEQGDAVEQYNIALMYYKGHIVEQNDEQAVFWYSKAAEQGYVEAQYSLGCMYRSGYGIEQDREPIFWHIENEALEQAIFWYQEAANQGYAPAQFDLGEMYEDPLGGIVDLEQSIFWYRKAAEQGHVNAQCNLGCMYENQEDNQQAVFWWRKSAEQGNSDAQEYLTNLGINWQEK